MNMEKTTSNLLVFIIIAGFVFYFLNYFDVFNTGSSKRSAISISHKSDYLINALEYGKEELMKTNESILKEEINDHIKWLKANGINSPKLYDFAVTIDYSVINEDNSGGLYRKLSPEQVLDEIVIYAHSNNYDTKVIRKNLRESFIHEYGHFIGYRFIHPEDDFTKFHEIRGNEVFETDEDYLHYNVNWRNLPQEQFAETYTEVYIDGHINKTASPNLTDEQKEKFMELLVENI